MCVVRILLYFIRHIFLYIQKTVKNMYYDYFYLYLMYLDIQSVSQSFRLFLFTCLSK